MPTVTKASMHLTFLETFLSPSLGDEPQDEARIGHAWGRHLLSATSLHGAPLHYGIVAMTKHHVRKKYGLHPHIATYRAERKAISDHPTMSGRQKRDAKEQLYHHTLDRMAQHVHTQNGGHMAKAYRTAHRALHGTMYGTGVL